MRKLLRLTTLAGLMVRCSVPLRMEWCSASVPRKLELADH